MKSFLSRKLAAVLLLAVAYGAAFAAPIVYNAPTNVTLGGSVDILPTVTSGGACTSTSNQNVGISADRKTIYSCVTNQWRSVEGTYWRDPVANFTALSAITTDPLGAARLTRNDGRVYSWNGAAWTPAAIDQNGNLSVPGVLTAGSASITGNLTANGNATVAGTLTASGNAVVTGTLTANGNTSVAGALTTSGNVTLGSSSANSVVVNGGLTANHGMTIGNGTAATASNTLVINRVASETAACSPNGAVARDANGLLLSCRSSVWKKVAQGGAKITTSDIPTTFCPSTTICAPSPFGNFTMTSIYAIDGACNLYQYTSATAACPSTAGAGTLIGNVSGGGTSTGNIPAPATPATSYSVTPTGLVVVHKKYICNVDGCNTLSTSESTMLWAQ